MSEESPYEQCGRNGVSRLPVKVYPLVALSLIRCRCYRLGGVPYWYADLHENIGCEEYTKGVAMKCIKLDCRRRPTGCVRWT